MSNKLSKYWFLSSLLISQVPFVYSLTSCNNETLIKKLEKKCNDWADKYQKDFYNKLSYTYHNYYEQDKVSNLHCTSGAEACVMYAYGPGYWDWNHKLHDGKGNTEELDKGVETEYHFGVPTPKDPYYNEWGEFTQVTGNILSSDYKYLDEALNLSTVGKVDTVYHGLENDESDLISFVNDTLKIDLEKTDPSEARKADLSLLTKSSGYTDYGYCATSFNKSHSYNYFSESVPNFKSSIFLQIKLDEDVRGGIYRTQKRNILMVSF